MRACKLLGHSYRFTAEGETMRWTCERGCGDGGSKRYASAEDAQRYARVFDQRDAGEAGQAAAAVAAAAVARPQGGRSG